MALLDFYYEFKDNLIRTGHEDIEIKKIYEPVKTSRGWQFQYYVKTIHPNREKYKYKQKVTTSVTFDDVSSLEYKDEISKIRVPRKETSEEISMAEKTARAARFVLIALRDGNEQYLDPVLLHQPIDKNRFAELLVEFCHYRVEDLVNNYKYDQEQAIRADRSLSERSWAYYFYSYLLSKDITTLDKFNENKNCLGGFKTFLYKIVPCDHFERRYQFYERYFPEYEIKQKERSIESELPEIKDIISRFRDGESQPKIKKECGYRSMLIKKTRMACIEENWKDPSVYFPSDQEIIDKLEKKNQPLSYESTIPKIITFVKNFFEYLRDTYERTYIRKIKDEELSPPNEEEIAKLEDKKHRPVKTRRETCLDEKQLIFNDIPLMWKMAYLISIHTAIRRDKVCRMIYPLEVNMDHQYFALYKRKSYFYKGRPYISKNKSKRYEVVFMPDELHEVLKNIYLPWREEFIKIQRKLGNLPKEPPPSLLLVTKQIDTLGCPRDPRAYYKRYKKSVNRLGIENPEQLDIHAIKGDRLTESLSLRMLAHANLDEVADEGSHRDKKMTFDKYIRQEERLILSTRPKAKTNIRYHLDYDRFKDELNEQLQTLRDQL